MEITEILPTLNEYKYRLELYRLKCFENPLLKSILSKLQLPTLDDYIFGIHYIFAHICDWEKMFDTIDENFEEHGKLTISAAALIAECSNEAAFEEAVAKSGFSVEFTEEEDILNGEFISKLEKIFIQVLFEKLIKSGHDVEFQTAFFEEIYTQLAWIDPSAKAEGEEIIAFWKAVALKNSNDILKKLQNSFFYCNENSHLLQKIHNKLVEHSLIEANEEFSSPFMNEASPAESFKKTVWLGKSTVRQALVLLYYFANKSVYLDNKTTIASFAFRAFKFKDNTTANTIAVSSIQLKECYDDLKYIKKNMRALYSVLDSLGLLS